jgi:DAACS family dicarboxylate/amino acid:cation (Na+ or H+) symporter
VLSGGQKAQLAVTSALAAGIAGVPEAGLITLPLVLSSVGLPLASLPVLLTVDWLLGRLRAMTNVTSDLLVATLLDAVGGRTEPKVEDPG